MKTGDAIRAIRKRLGLNQTAFAETLGLKQGTISQYEAGELNPSRSVLLLLLNQADAGERGPLLDALGVEKSQQEGWAPGELEASLEKFERFLNSPRTLTGKVDDMRRLFVEMAMEIASDETGPVPGWLVHTMQLWLRYKPWADSEKFFEHLPIYLDVQLKSMPPPPTAVQRAMRQVGRKERK